MPHFSQILNPGQGENEISSAHFQANKATWSPRQASCSHQTTYSSKLKGLPSVLQVIKPQTGSIVIYSCPSWSLSAQNPLQCLRSLIVVSGSTIIPSSQTCRTRTHYMQASNRRTQPLPPGINMADSTQGSPLKLLRPLSGCHIFHPYISQWIYL